MPGSSPRVGGSCRQASSSTRCGATSPRPARPSRCRPSCSACATRSSPSGNGSPTLLLTEGPGYRLALDPAQVDAERFARLARIGERSLADGRPENAAATLTEALALWRGPAYAGFDGAAFAVAEARRLEELRISATEDRLAAELALGRAAAAVPELERLVGEHPMRERLWEMLVTALYRAGRQGDALGAYERARAVLSDELGVDPGPGLRAVHARVLAHDPTLGSPTVRQTIPPQLRLARTLVGRDEELARLRDAWQRGGTRSPGHRRRPRARGCRGHGPGRGAGRRGGPRGCRRRLPAPVRRRRRVGTAGPTMRRPPARTEPPCCSSPTTPTCVPRRR